jgi:hypothetical protein
MTEVQESFLKAAKAPAVCRTNSFNINIQKP